MMFIVFLFLLFTAPNLCAAMQPSQVLIVVNKDSSDSARVARIYQKLRAVPEVNLLSLHLGETRNITPDEYWKRAGLPIRKYLEANPAIRCVLTTAGVPYTISARGNEDDTAFDNELAASLREEPHKRVRGAPNPLYLNGMNPSGVMDPRLFKMV